MVEDRRVKMQKAASEPPPEGPIAQFERWWDEWVATDPYDAAACVVATATPEGHPSARFVLCRSFDEQGFVFYTNQESRKAHELDDDEGYLHGVDSVERTRIRHEQLIDQGLGQ